MRFIFIQRFLFFVSALAILLSGCCCITKRVEPRVIDMDQNQTGYCPFDPKVLEFTSEKNDSLLYPTKDPIQEINQNTTESYDEYLKKSRSLGQKNSFRFNLFE